MICNMVGWAIFGLLVGALARLFWPGRTSMGLTVTMIVGIVGSVLGGLITTVLFRGPDATYEPAGWIMSIVGALLFLWLTDATARRRNP